VPSGREADSVAVWRLAAAQTERRAQRVALWGRQPGNTVQERAQQPVQRAEPQLGLGFDASQTDHGQVDGGSGGVLEQARLADARFAGQHQHPGQAVTSRRDQCVDRVALDATAQQWPRRGEHEHDARRAAAPDSSVT
jgi:hypothetical protein